MPSSLNVCPSAGWIEYFDADALANYGKPPEAVPAADEVDALALECFSKLGV